MSAFEQRVMGRLSERLLDTWLNCTHTPYVECGVQNLEHTNWLKKGGSFLAAKFLGKRYTKSFQLRNLTLNCATYFKCQA